MLQVVYRPRAKRDLESAVIYIGEVLSSPLAAKTLYRELQHIISLVQENPLMGTVFADETLERTYRGVLAEKYRIFYSVEDNQLIIWRIIHCSQDIDGFSFVEL